MTEPPIRPYPHPPPPAVLRAWRPRGPEAAAAVIALIAERLPRTTIEHVGSSSAPGCDGKGYLDFVIPYRDDGMHDSVDYAKTKGAFVAALGYKGAEGA